MNTVYSVLTTGKTARFVGIVTRLRTGQSGVRSQAVVRRFSIPRNVHIGCGDLPTTYSLCTSVLSGGKATGA